jgi:tetratricopeptide (TPR) repeat protein
MVVDPGCMKCTDCISVCPKGALHYGFAKPALLKQVPAVRRAKRYDLSLGEELLVAAVALVATLVYRDLYNGPPLLLSVGLGGITGYLALKLWQLAMRPVVRAQNLELKLGGRVTRAGAVSAALTVAWLAFTSHSAFAQWHRAWGRYELERTEVSRADGLSGAFRSKTYSTQHARSLAAAFRHFSLADRFGLVDTVDVKLGLAWCHVLRGELDEAAVAARRAAAKAPDRAELGRNVTDIEAAAWAGAFERASARAEAGDLESAARDLAVCVARAPESAPARFNYGGVLRRLGRHAEAVDQFAVANRLSPGDPDTLVELGLAYKELGSKREAVAAFKAAIAAAPGRPESQQYLPELIEELEPGVR